MVIFTEYLANFKAYKARFALDIETIEGKLLNI